MRRRSPVVAAVLAAVFVLAAACSGNDDDGGDRAGGGGSDPAPAPAAATRVAVVFPGERDGAFVAGIERQPEVEVTVRDGVTDPAARIDVVRELGRSHDLVLGVGPELGEAGVTVAPELPRTTFVIVEGQDSAAPNLHVYGVRRAAGAFVAGRLAKAMSETRKVGFVGGEEVPATTSSDAGFRAGAQSSEGEPAPIQYLSTLTGVQDEGPGRDAASAQVRAGADVVLTMVGGGVGGARTITTGRPRCGEPDVVATVVVDPDALAAEVMRDFAADRLAPEPKLFGLDAPAVQRVEVCPPADTPANRTAVDQAVADVTAGRATFPPGV